MAAVYALLGLMVLTWGAAVWASVTEEGGRASRNAQGRVQHLRKVV